MSDIKTKELYPWVPEDERKAWLKAIERNYKVIGTTQKAYRGRREDFKGQSITTVYYQEKK